MIDPCTLRVTYNSPNRSHHVAFARAMREAGYLLRFVAGISRFSPQFDAQEFGNHLRRADHLQNLYLAALTKGAPKWLTDELAYLAKIWIDWRSTGPARKSNVFMFYSGAGLHTCRRVKSRGTRCVVEAVNSHVTVQEDLLRGEASRLGLKMPPFHRREVRRRLAEYALADAVICSSQFVRSSFVAQGFPEKNIFVVPYGFYPPSQACAPRESARPVPSGSPSGEPFRILYVGQIHLRKGLRYLLQAFNQLNTPNKELLLAGHRLDPSGIADLPIPTNVRFCGVVRGDDLDALYRSATVFVQPSIEEGLSLVLGEALSYGLPVLATENTGACDLFSDGVEGFIVPIRDPQAIAEKLQLLANDSDRRRQMSALALARASKLGGWDECGKKLIAALTQIANR